VPQCWSTYLALQGGESAVLRVYCSSPIGGVYADITAALIQQYQQVCLLVAHRLVSIRLTSLQRRMHDDLRLAAWQLSPSVGARQAGQEEVKLWVKAQRQPNMEVPNKARDVDEKETSSQVRYTFSPASKGVKCATYCGVGHM
jgi:hypothetical protein